MSEKIVEPVPVGVRGHLSVEADGLRFVRGDSRVRLGSRLAPAEALGLKMGDMLAGWLQCYRGWTAQPEALVERWLEECGEESEEARAKGDLRVIFRVSDFERLDSEERGAMSLLERKALLDRRLEDRDMLQKNPYLLLSDEQVEGLLASQPAGSKWHVRRAEGDEAESDKETLPGRMAGEGADLHRESVPSEGLDVAVAGGWLDLAAVEQRIRQGEERIQEQERQLSRLTQERDELVEQRKSEERLRRAGEHCLAALRARGERCIRAIAAGSDVEERLGAYGSLFESSEVEFEALERRTEALERQLEQLYPTQPVARSSGLDLPKPSAAPSWESFRVRRAGAEE